MPDSAPSSMSDNPSYEGEDFYELAYDQLRHLAHMQMAKEYQYSTLQGTALVHEAWLRLGAEDQPEWQNQRHLFKAASRAMRHILIERARKRDRKKNGGEFTRVAEEQLQNLSGDHEVDRQLLVISDALEKFAEIDPRKAELVRLRYFFGLSFEETADTMDISVSTAKRWWVYSRSWLHREMAKA